MLQNDGLGNLGLYAVPSVCSKGTPSPDEGVPQAFLPKIQVTAWVLLHWAPQLHSRFSAFLTSVHYSMLPVAVGLRHLAAMHERGTQGGFW